MSIRKSFLKGLKVAIITLFMLGAVGAGVLYFGLRGIPESHIEGNVPDEEVFDRYLSRDLKNYFQKFFDEPITISYIMLRDEPTQVGLAAPKYYLWVTVANEDDTKELNSGAVRVGANGKTSFTITDFVDQESIKNDSSQLSGIFPDEVVQSILDRLE